ncbi:hypothetical protein EBU94_00330 [bacterium]|nr:hypothetical protein [bacterium]
MRQMRQKRHIKLFEQFINESALGPKATKLTKRLGDDAQYFSDIPEENLGKEYHDAVKKSGINPDNAMIVFTYGADMEFDKVMKLVKSSGCKHIVVTDSETGEDAVIFDINESTHFGPKAKSLYKILGDDAQWFADIPEENLGKEYHDAIKKSKINPDNAMIVFTYGADMEFDDVMKLVKSSGCRFVVVTDSETGEDAVIIDGMA